MVLIKEKEESTIFKLLNLLSPVYTRYLIYIHYRYFHAQNSKQALTILALAFLVLLVCWFGVNYLPVANTSVHTYTQY